MEFFCPSNFQFFRSKKRRIFHFLEVRKILAHKGRENFENFTTLECLIFYLMYFGLIIAKKKVLIYSTLNSLKKTFNNIASQKNLPYSIRIYWTNFWRPTVHVQQNIFEKTFIEVCSLHLYASFGTFCAQKGLLFEAQWIFQVLWKSTNHCYRQQAVKYFFIKFKHALIRWGFLGFFFNSDFFCIFFCHIWFYSNQFLEA